jgi:hypothetical protein
VRVQQRQRCIDARRLEQLERRHHVANHGHIKCSSKNLFIWSSGHFAIPFGQVVQATKWMAGGQMPK